MPRAPRLKSENTRGRFYCVDKSEIIWYTFTEVIGNEQYLDGADTNPFRYCGEFYDTETRYIYLRARYYSPRTGRFISEDPARDGTNWYVYCGNDPVNFVDPDGTEYIVVSGGLYSVNDGNFDYNFIEPAIKKLNELAALNDNENIKWIIANEGWSKDDISKFNKVASSVSNYYSANVSLKMIDNKNELIKYINTKDNYSRTEDKIKKLVVFSHGLIDDGGTISLGYNYSSYNTDLNISKKDINSISASAFENANVWLGSCNLATKEDNFAQAWVDKFGGKIWAFYGKSDYSRINSGQGLDVWLSRKFNGFSMLGSANYPIAGTNAEIRSFTR